MKIILANDDGFDSMGIVELGKKLSQKFNVITIAPSFEQSAKGHSFSLAKPLRLKQVEETRYHLNGTPADCVYFGLHHILPEADVVISGMNHGANLGQDVYYSGTCAAAREGAIQGRKAMAISIWEKDSDIDYEKAAEIAVLIICRLLREEWTEGMYWNVNIPSTCLKLPKEEIPVTIKPLGHRRYMSNVEERNDPRGGTYFWIGGRPVPTEDDDMDAFWCEQGMIVMTPLQLDCTEYNIPLMNSADCKLGDFISQ